MTRLNKLFSMVGAAALLVGSGCGDLDVTNPNNPDVERALASANDVKSLASSSFKSWYQTSTNNHPFSMASVTGDVHTAIFGNFGMRWNNQEAPQTPTGRRPYENSSAGVDRDVTEIPWNLNYATLGAANDALRAFAAGVALPTAVETAKYKHLAQFAQAGSLMNLALWFDKAFIVDETFDLSGAPPELSPFTAVSATALAKWEALIAATATGSNTYTAAEFPMTPELTTNRLHRIANTMAAVTMAYTPRSGAQNAAVNWAKVATLANNGIGTGAGGAPFDVLVTGDGFVVEACNNWCSKINRYGNEHSWMRIDHRLINLMDGTTPVKYDGTVVPKGTSPDARYNTDFGYCGAGAVANGGAPACVASVIGDPLRGLYMQSHWYHKRYEHHARSSTTAGKTAVPYMLAAESDLIRAEALIRSGGSAATAAALINNSRVGRGQLSPLTGAEGTAALLAAIDYERQVELLTTNGFELLHARQDLNGVRLQTGTPRHLPIPAKELETLGLPIYTFGGAVANPAGF